MPVVMASASRSSDALIRYALEDKPGQVGERYVMASGVGGLLVSLARQQMRDVRKKWGKDRPGAFVHAYHVIQSFGRDELDPALPASWMTAQRLGRALAETQFPGRQVLVVTQRDGKTGCVHNHIVINSVDRKTGRSLDSSLVMHARLVEVHERVLAAEGFQQRPDLKQAFSDAVDRRERGERSGLRRVDTRKLREEREFQNYILWEVENDVADEFGAPHRPEPFSTTVLKASIRNALDEPDAIDWDSLVEAGRKHGVVVRARETSSHGISYGMLRAQSDGTVSEPSKADTRRDSTLGVEFEREAAEAALSQNLAATKAPADKAVLDASDVLLTLAERSPLTQRSADDALARLRAALDEVHASADEQARARIAAARNAPHIRGADQIGVPRTVELQDVIQGAIDAARPTPATESAASLGVDGSLPLAVDAIETPSLGAEKDVVGSSPTPLEAPATEPTPNEPTATEQTETAKPRLTLKQINDRNRRLGLPQVSKRDFDAHRHMSDRQRELRIKHPELLSATKTPPKSKAPRPSLE